MPEKGEELYKILKADPNYEGVGSDYNKFKEFFSNEKNYANLYNTLKADANYEGIGSDANAFSEYFGLKKKDQKSVQKAEPKQNWAAETTGGQNWPSKPLAQGVGLGVKPTLNTASPSPSSQPKSTTPSEFIESGLKNDPYAQAIGKTVEAGKEKPVKKEGTPFVPPIPVLEIGKPWKGKPNTKEFEIPKQYTPEKPYIEADIQTKQALDALPTYSRSVIGEGAFKRDFADYLKQNPTEAQKLIAWQGDDIKYQEEQHQVLKNYYTSKVQPLVQKIEQYDQQGVGASLEKANQVYTNLDKIQDDLKKSETQVKFFVNSYLEQNGYSDIVKQAKELKNKINSFDDKAFTQQIDKLKEEKQQIDNEIAPLIVGEGVPEEYFQKYLELKAHRDALVGEINKLIDSPEALQYNQNIAELNKTINTQNELAQGLQSNPQYKKAFSAYEAISQKYLEQINETKQFEQMKPLFKDYIATASQIGDISKKYNNVVQGFPAVISREELQKKVDILGEQGDATKLKGLGVLQSLPQSANNIFAGVGSALAKLDKTIQGADDKDYYSIYDKMSDYYDNLNKMNSYVVPSPKAINKDGSLNWSEIGYEGLSQWGNMAIFATIGGYGKAPMVATAYFMSRKQREEEADAAGLKGAAKEAYVSTLSTLEGLSELIMPDNQLFTKNIKSLLLKEAVQAQTKGINWFRKRAMFVILENGGKESVEEYVVKIGELFQKVASNYSNGNAFDISEYKKLNEWVRTGLVAAPLAGLSTAYSQRSVPKQALNLARYEAAKNLTQTRSILDDLVEGGKMTTEKADAEYKKIVSYAAVQSIIPKDISNKKAVEIVPLLIENEKLKLQMNEVDEVFKDGIKEKIAANTEKAKQILNQKEENKFEENPEALAETPIDEKQMYQGREFMDKTGLEPGLYTPQEVENAKAQKLGKPINTQENEDKQKNNEANGEVVLGRVREAGNEGEVGQEGEQLREEEVTPKTKELESLVNQIPVEDLRRPNGSIGTQGFTEENMIDVARFISREMGFDIPAFDSSLGTSEIKQLIEYLRGNKEAQQKIKEYVIKNPVVTSLLPDGTYAVEDGNHRANLLNLIGVDVIPTIELNGRDKQTAINEHNSKVEAVEQSLKETPQAGSVGVGGDVKSYKGMFNPKKTGISGLDDLLTDDGYNYFYKGVSGEIIMMSPDEYLKKVRDDITRSNIDLNVLDEKKASIIEGINKGDKINMPYLSLKENGQAHKQEGRNRAVVAKERGEKLIPVFIEKDISFEDKVVKGKEYINSAIKDGATTKDEVLSKLKEQGLHRDAIRFIDNNFDNKAVEQSLKETPKTEVASPEAIETGRQEVSAVKKGKVKTTNPIRLFKGLFGKRNPDGTRKTAHPGTKGVFSAIDEKTAERYVGEDGMGTFDIPAGTTIEVIRLPNRGTAISKFRQEEVDAINASDAQIVKLITMDAKGAEEQYIIKDPALIEKMQKPKEAKKENKEQANPALKDVEATTKALEGVNTFDQQDENAEVLVGKEKDRWGRSQVWRERIENAGDILRELSSRGKNPDVKYLQEKIDKIKNWIFNGGGFNKLPKTIKTLKDVDESSIRFSSAVDGKEYLDKFHNDILQETIDAYKAIVVKTQEEQVVKDFILTLLQGDKSSIYSKLREVEDIVEKIKKQKELKSTPLNVSEAYHKTKAEGVENDLTKAVEELLKPKEAKKENVGYRQGDLGKKAENLWKMSSEDRSTGHFGTGYYFFGKKENAEGYEANKRGVTKINLDNYNLAKGTKELHALLKRVNEINSKTKDADVKNAVKGVMEYLGLFPEEPKMSKNPTDAEWDALREYNKKKDELIAPIAAAVQKQNERLKTENIDTLGENAESLSTVLMKALGYEGIDSRGTELDNSRYGSVVYDIKPEGKQKFTDNVLKIAEETGLSPQEVERTYVKYEGAKNIEDITTEDYLAARESGDKVKLENSKEAFKALLEAEKAKESASPTVKKNAEKNMEQADKEALKGAKKLMEHMAEIQRQLLDNKVISTIKCKWGNG